MHSKYFPGKWLEGACPGWESETKASAWNRNAEDQVVPWTMLSPPPAAPFFPFLCVRDVLFNSQDPPGQVTRAGSSPHSPVDAALALSAVLTGPTLPPGVCGFCALVSVVLCKCWAQLNLMLLISGLTVSGYEFNVVLEKFTWFVKIRLGFTRL